MKKYFDERLKPQTKVSVLASCVPVVLINANALTKMQVYVDSCAQEIGWMGTAYMDEDRQVYIQDVFLFDQEVHATTTEITPEGLSDFATELLNRSDGMEIWNNLKMWGHSHVNMGVTPSGQDDKQMETFAETGHDWFLRLIANKKGDLKIDLYDYKNGIVLSDLPWEEMTNPVEEEIRSKISALLDEIEELNNTRLTHYKAPVESEMKVKVRQKTWVNTGIRTYGTQAGVEGYWQGGKFQPNQEKTSTSNNGGTGGNTDSDKKKDNASPSESTGNSYVDAPNLIESRKDVYTYFKENELLEIGLCQSLNQVHQEIEDMGYVNFFTHDDVLAIYEEARDVVDDHYDNQHWTRY